ncbi:hypothetical protein PvNV_092 [Penaeus vannamei nudivirus]|nr:hypothetical protein PvSNPV_092 [Penaeus vannamei nucleopolyhedrovirus]
MFLNFLFQDVVLGSEHNKREFVIINNVQNLTILPSFCTNLNVRGAKILKMGYPDYYCNKTTNIRLWDAVVDTLPPYNSKVYMDNVTIDSFVIMSPSVSFMIVRSKVGYLESKNSVTGKINIHTTEIGILKMSPNVNFTIARSKVGYLESKNAVKKIVKIHDSEIGTLKKLHFSGNSIFELHDIVINDMPEIDALQFTESVDASIIKVTFNTFHRANTSYIPIENSTQPRTVIYEICNNNLLYLTIAFLTAIVLGTFFINISLLIRARNNRNVVNV